ncbi:ABC transporter ATP-binding protein [Dinghuibacter silviterrae]|uniref:Subfamily B ATP-binding cassette protein MsbA n=1 Tax=Dinghuibacter silviterrae TaxID=1539049 RepID=A0A4V3GLF7_9BACT|nr:ABC transporter ATP-binding protein [Dinghuibacter silviterrae]TDW99412.1 subfamily B ATP-binding cassette protein MsbA [Dinghuibacter silviterrae]
MKKYTRLFKYLKDLKWSIVLYTGLTILSVAFSLVSLTMLIPFMNLLFHPDQLVHTLPQGPMTNSQVLIDTFKYYLTKIIESHSMLYAMAVICGIILLAIALKNFFLYCTYYILAPMRNSLVRRLKDELYAKILELPIGYFTEQRKGDVLSRMTNDTYEIETSVLGTMDGLIKDPINIIFLLVALFVLSPALSLFLLVFLPITGFVIGRISRSLRKTSNAAAIKAGESLSVLEETLSGLRVIKAFNVEKLLGNKFFTLNDELFHLKNRMQQRRDLASPLSEVMGVGVLCGVLLFGGYLITTHSAFALAPEAFIAYLAAFSQIINPAKSISTSWYNIQKGSAAVARIEEVLNATVTVKDLPGAQTLDTFQHSIEFRGISFAYGDHQILENINLTIPKGKTVALVGSSGAGKSTLADLVPRFHDVTNGELLIDGVNIKGYTLESLRRQISIVTQEPILFNDTIAANIALGEPDASREAIMDAARVANADNFIRQKEGGYESNIGDRGTKLSGGERQRLTIARAVLKNPPILILDEATSSLDTESERLVQDAIYKLMKDRTSLVIAHRLSTIRHADEIIVLQKGRIAERGTHDQLIEAGGIYRRLVEMQEVK